MQAQRHAFCHDKDHLALIWLHVLCVMQTRADTCWIESAGCLVGDKEVSRCSFPWAYWYSMFIRWNPSPYYDDQWTQNLWKAIISCERRIQGELSSFTRTGRETVTLKRWPSVNQGERLTRNLLGSIWNLDFPVSRTMGNKSLWFKHSQSIVLCCSLPD